MNREQRGRATAGLSMVLDFDRASDISNVALFCQYVPTCVAVIALPNDEDEIPQDPRRRLELVRKIVDVATGTYGIPLEDRQLCCAPLDSPAERPRPGGNRARLPLLQ